MKKILNAFTWAWAVYKRPETFQPYMLKLLDGIRKYIEDTQKLNHPTMTQIAIIHGNENTPILSFWCGIGYDSTPLKRIEELVEENRRLKLEINMMITEQNKQS
jgi:hypothetical protein